MKIVFINSVYGCGSTGKIIKNLYEKFSSDSFFEPYVISRKGLKTDDKKIMYKTFKLESKIHHFFSLFTGNMYGGMLFSTLRIKRTISKIKPNIVNVHCLNGYYVNLYELLKWLAKKQYKTVLTMHADFMMTGNCGIAGSCNKYLTGECSGCEKVKEFNGKFSLNRTHKFYKKLKKALSYFSEEKLKISCVSPWLEKRYCESELYSRFTNVSIFNPVDNLFFSSGKINPFKEGTNVIYVTPDIYDENKSGYLIEDIAKVRPDVNFYVICTKDVEYHFNNSNITYIKGGVTQEALRDYYYFADATLILSKRETFSMAAAESLACGTPVIGFKCGGPETICVPQYSLFFDRNNLDQLAKSICKNVFNKKEVIDAAMDCYSSDKIFEDYKRLFLILEGTSNE